MGHSLYNPGEIGVRIWITESLVQLSVVSFASMVVDMYEFFSNWTYHQLTRKQDKAIKNALFFTEIRAGLTTFFTMAYIISVNVSSGRDTGQVTIAYTRIVCYSY